MAEMNKKQRQEIEGIIYSVFDILDKTKTNSEHYKKLFSKMDDKQFLKFISLRFPYRFHVTPFKIEPTMDDVKKACDKLGIPLLEKLNLPYLYEDKNGVPVQSKECLVGYVHLKKVQQFITKKNSMSLDISQRDMKSGRLTGVDKNGQTTDREMEALAVVGLENTMKEFGRAKADSMKAKNAMYNTINTTGMVSLKDLPDEIDDSLSKNYINAYLIGSHINTNLVNQDYYLPYTLKNKQRQVTKI